MSTSSPQPVFRAEGVTTSERYLQRLARGTFLSLWAHAGIYRDQGKTDKNPQGKEVCDLLVVFQNHILIFSDKDCKFPDTENLKTDWGRWFRRAVLKSADQVLGAERWIREHPDRLFLDPPCTQKFPFDLPDPTTATFHRILVAHGASSRCRKEHGGSGSLMLRPGDTSGTTPFVIGSLGSDGGYVHVFDDTSLGIVMRELDTAPDFIEYLTKKERFIASGKLFACAGEEELLGYYLRTMNSEGEWDFVISKDTDSISLVEGFWDDHKKSNRRLAKAEADEVSYVWDRIIETFNSHILNGTSYGPATPVSEREAAIRMLASSSRTARRVLGTAFNDFLHQSPANTPFQRIVEPVLPGQPYHVLVTLPQDAGLSDDQYRKRRSDYLTALLRITKVVFPGARDIVGLATEPGTASERSGDVAYLNARPWTQQDQEESEELQRATGLLTRLKRTQNETHFDFPITSGPLRGTRPGRRVGRNDQCPCGSGRKFKRCCLP
jgi:hypothetical protein